MFLGWGKTRLISSVCLVVFHNIFWFDKNINDIKCIGIFNLLDKYKDFIKQQKNEAK